MTSPIRVLITGAGGDVAQGVLKCLQNSPLELKIFATCINPYSPMLHMPGVTGFRAPLSSDKDYVQFLINLARDRNIQVIFPTVDSEILKLTAAKAHIEKETGAVLFASDYHPTLVCNDKYLTHEFLKTNNLPTPRSVQVDSSTSHEQILRTIDYPFLIKNRTGNASLGISVICDEHTFMNHPLLDGQIAQQLLPNDCGEYTGSVYITDDKKKKISCLFRRTLKNGSTNLAENITNINLLQQLELIASKLLMKYVNIQAMLVDGTLIPFEFNGRLSGTTEMISRVFNPPELFIRERILGHEIQHSENNHPFIAVRHQSVFYLTQDQIDQVVTRSLKYLA